jgi:O-antigen/teichoic acid export membrane protein
MESIGVQDLRAFIRGLAPRIWASPLARGSFFVFLGTTGSTALTLVKSILIARALGSEVFGLMTYAITLALFAAQFIDMKTGDNLVRFVGRAIVQKEPTKAVTYFQLGIVIDAAAALVALLAIGLIVVPLVGGHPQHELLQGLIRIFIWAVPFRLLKSPFDGVLVAFRRFHVLAALQIVARIGELAVVVAVLPYGVLALVWAAVLVAALEFLLSVGSAGAVFWRQTRAWRGEGYRAAWREMRPFAVYGSLFGSLKSLTANLDVVVLGALWPASEVSYYTIARSAASVLATFTRPVSQAVYPLMNEAWSVKDRPRVRQLIGRLVLLNGSASLAAILFLQLTAHGLVVLFYGTAFAPAASVLRLMIVFVGLQIVTGWMRQMILIAGYPRLDFIAGLIGTGFYLILLAPFIAWRGAQGLAVLLILDVLVISSAFAWLGSQRVRLWEAPAPDDARIADANPPGER